MRSTNENFDVFNSRDEIYLVFTKKVNFLFILYFLEDLQLINLFKKQISSSSELLFNSSLFGGQL